MKKKTYRVEGQSEADAIRIATGRAMCDIFESGSDETTEWVTRHG